MRNFRLSFDLHENITFVGNFRELESLSHNFMKREACITLYLHGRFIFVIFFSLFAIVRRKGARFLIVEHLVKQFYDLSVTE